jgi:dipeptidyl aminopeptidase/acylaminoacyl peptidase
MDAAGGIPRRFRNMTQELIWSPHTDEVVWSGLTQTSSASGLFRMPLNRTLGEGDWLIAAQSGAPSPYPQDWSESGFLLYRPTTGDLGDLMALPLNGGLPIEVARSDADESNGRFAPNGKWVVYQSDQIGGRNEIFLQRFPGSISSRKQVSVAGGTRPRWGRGGRELYFIAPDFRLMVVDVTYSQGGDQIDLAEARPLFPTPLPAGSEFEVTADGERFLMNTPLKEAPPIVILTNWNKAK